MKHSDTYKPHDTVSVAGARRGGNRRWRLEHLTAQCGHSVQNNDNNHEEI